MAKLNIGKFDADITLPVAQSQGFFGLNELHRFFVRDVEAYFSKNVGKKIIIDFSQVKVWDISAILWTIIALSHYKKEGRSSDIEFRLRLPQADLARGADGEDYRRSADFLRRWRLDRALSNIADDPASPESVLVPEQHDYFKSDVDKLKYYQPADREIHELLRELITIKLVEIRNLVDVFNTDERKISKELMQKSRKIFAEKAISSVLQNKAGISESIASDFSEKLIAEGLLNIEEHPKATIGMLAVATLGNANRLILAIADNGQPIQETIFPHYRASLKAKRRAVHLRKTPAKYPRKFEDVLRKISFKDRWELLNHATVPGVSRKRVDENGNITFLPLFDDDHSKMGMGLFYIRRDATSWDKFRGELIIAANGVSVKYVEPGQLDPSKGSRAHDYNFPWEGNLLRISIPICESAT